MDHSLEREALLRIVYRASQNSVRFADFIRLSEIRKGRVCDEIATLLLSTLSKIGNSVLREAGDSHTSSKLIYIDIYRLVLIRRSYLALSIK